MGQFLRPPRRSRRRGGARGGLGRALRAAIRGGRLQPGERLPSTRALAHDLGLARGTVAEAYAQLAAEGYLRTHQGAPTRVAARNHAPVPPRRAPAPVTPVGFSARGRPERFDLRVGVPDAGG